MLVPIIVGIILGILAGVLPGLHPNTISQIISSADYGSSFEIAALIVVSSAVNNIVALIPAIFFFIPDSDSVLSILPAQRLVKSGKGRLAVRTCAIAALLSLVFLVLVLPISYISLPFLYDLAKPYIGHALVLFSILFILQELPGGPGAVLKAAFVFGISGALGFLLLSTPLSSAVNEPMFAAFIGFFALSSILLSFSEKSAIPHQHSSDKKTALSSSIVVIVFLSVLLGGIADILPAINSPAQLATFLSPIAGTSTAFLAATTSITVSHYANSLVAFDTIGKARTGTIVHISELMGEFSDRDLLALVLFYFVGTGLGIILFLLISELIIKIVNRIDQKAINILILSFLLVSVGMVSGLLGLFVCGIATAMGLLPPMLGVRRTHLMAFLIVPSIALLLF